MVGIEAAQDRCGSLRGGGIACELVPARGEWDGSGMGECKEGFPGDMPGIRAPGEGPETCGEPGQGPTLGLADTSVYGELGSRVPGDCVVIMDGEGGTWYGLGGDVRGGYTPLPGGCVWVWGMKVSSMLIGEGGLSSSLTERLRASWLLSTNMFRKVLSPGAG